MQNLPIVNPTNLEFEKTLEKKYNRRGYTKIGVCPHCGSLNKKDYVMEFHCDTCNNDVTYWLDKRVLCI